MNSRTLLIFVAALLLLVALAGGGAFYWSIAQDRAYISNGLPTIPRLQRHPEALSVRIQSSDQQARNGYKPIQALGELSALYHSNGFLDEALACYELLILLEPSNPRWSHLAATIHASYGMLDRAIPLWETAIAKDPRYLPSQLQRGNALLKQNRFQEAEIAFSESLSLEPENAYALLGQGRAAIEKQDWQAARKLLERAIKSSNFQVGTDLLATVYRQLGENERADLLLGSTAIGAYPNINDSWLAETYAHSYDPYALSVAAGQADHSGDSETGAKLLKRALAFSPDDPMLHMQMATLSLKSNQVKQAESHLQTCLKLQPDLPDAWIQLAILYRNSGDALRFQATLAEGFQKCPDSPGMLLEIARLKTEQKKWSEAVPLLNKSIRLRPNEADAYIELAQCYFGMDRVNEGMVEMRRALNAEPAHPVALSTACYYAIANRDLNAADQYFKKIHRQPLLRSQEVQVLEKLYRETFGREPREP